MKFKDKEYVFTTDKITDIWVALKDERALSNNKEINHRNAFSFIKFLNCEYVLVHSIESLAKTFDVSTENIVKQRDCLQDFTYGNGNDREVFEYIRSLCAVHPTDTSMHPTVHKAGEFDCCSRIV